MTITVESVYALCGGMFICGSCVLSSLDFLLKYRFTLNIFDPKSRQTCILFLTFIGSISLALYYGFTQSTKLSYVSNVTLFIGAACIQIGLSMINHNSIDKACIEWPEFSKKFNAFKNNVILVIYCVPLFILIPVIIGYLEASGQGVFLRFTPAYVDNYKPAVLCYVVVTNALAAIMDTIVLQRYMALKAKPFGWVPENPKIANIDRCYMYGAYVKILILFVVDIALIIVAAESLPSFDSSVTIELIRLRAVANLEFGLGFDRQSAKKHRDIKAHRQNELNDKQMNDADVAPREMKTAALYND